VRTQLTRSNAAHTQWDLLWPWFRHGPTPIRVPACGCQHVSTGACMRPDAYESYRKSHYSIGFKARYREAHTIGTQIQSSTLFKSEDNFIITQA